MGRFQNRCDCCGEEEGRGCVLGFRCKCDKTELCDLCTKCVEHHHKNCTEALRARAEKLRVDYDEAFQKLRDDNEINMFEYGERKEIF